MRPLLEAIRQPILWVAKIGEDPNNPGEIRTAKRVHMVGFAAAIIMCVFTGPIYLIFNEPLAGLNYLGFAPISLIVIWRYSRHYNHESFTRTMAIIVLLSNLITVLALGDLTHSGGAVLWGLCYPLVGYVIFYNLREALRWAIPFLTNLVICIFFGRFIRPETNLPSLVESLILYTNLITVFSILILAIGYFVAQRDQAYRLLRGEQVKADNLLLNILPAEIAAILKDEQRTIAEYYEGASILFADVVGFTPMSAKMTPVELVEVLNNVFSLFDGLLEKYHLEKIKTIGDCYMVAAGVPRPIHNHAQVLTSMALEMQQLVSDQKFSGHHLAFRIGINSGPVVAGVIGRKKFIYDLWGDAVNTASRMESHGTGGVVQITRATYELIKDAFICEPRGTVEVKGKGQMEVWHVTAPKVVEGIVRES